MTRAGAAALEAALAVVPEAGEHASERLGAGVEARASRVVLEARQRPLLAGLELALDQHVADHAALARDGLEREEPDARHLLAVEAAVAAAEQLVAAADREHRGAAVDRLAAAAPPSARRSSATSSLLAVLAAADVVEVVLAGRDRVAHPERGHLELVAAPSALAA